MNKELQNVILAALLHDIGKFYQRTGIKLNLDNPGDSYDYNTYTKKSAKGINTHEHAAYTAKFFREFLPGHEEIEKLAALHHNPENADNDQQRFLANIIALADRMSSGERSARDEAEELGTPQKEPLSSIFSLINLNNGKPAEEYYHPLTWLKPTLNTLFPVKDKHLAFGKRSGQEAYRQLWERFISEFRRLDRNDLLIQSYYLLYKYTLSIPAAVYRDKPDISLFHHLKTTAAIAACLFKLYQSSQIDEPKIKEILANLVYTKESHSDMGNSVLAKSDFLLVGGDISGIQDFIYQVTSEKALKGLRARSFYLQLLSEIMARKILNEFGLSEINLLYCGGGNFYLLIPQIKESEEKLAAIQKEIDEILLKAHKGKLAVIISWQSVSYHDFFANFARLWEELGAKLFINKRKKFSSLADKSNIHLFQNIVLGPFDTGGKKKGCEICGEEISEEERKRCSLCESFIEFSSEIANAELFLLEPKEKKTLPEKDITWQDVIAALGFQFQTGYLNTQWRHKALILNSTNFAGKYRGFYFVAKKTKDLDGNILTLERMANKATGIKKWGVLRADVDHLGKLFQEGLGNNKTISRVSTLSSMLSLYFSSRISQLEEAVKSDPKLNESTNENLVDYVYIAYSGGDDLFFIAPWSSLHDLAKFIYDDFRKFTCFKLTLSAGIFLAPSKKFPIYQAAHKAGEAEDKAKKEGRDRLVIFEETLPWDKYPKIKEIITLVKNLLNGEKGKSLPRSLISLLYQIYLEKELKKRASSSELSMERVWRFHYSLKKLMKGLNDNQQKDLERLLNLVIINYEVIPCLNIATRVADYLTRETKEVYNELS